jgi:hypothetical protein
MNNKPGTCSLCLRIISLLVMTLSVSIAQQKPEKMDLYLLIGQSNMAGRGKVDETSSISNDKIWTINKQNEWVPANDPLHFDKPVAGVGPGMAFAQAIRNKYPERVIGLIPCAVGGSGIDDWVSGVKHDQTGIYAYDAMIERVRLAKKAGKLKGILWHQGESDSFPEKSKLYEAKLTAFFKKLRKEIGARKTPLILGTLGDFYIDKNPEAEKINNIISEYASKNKNVYVVSSAGLPDLGDKTHFNTESARELGKRYAEKMIEIKN